MAGHLVNKDAGRQAKQLVMSSTAYGLVDVGAPVEEILRSLTPEIRQALPLAVRAVKQALLPADDDQQEELTVGLGRQIGLLKAGLAVEHKEDWIGIALGDLRDLPADLVLEVLGDVRRKVRFEGDVVPEIIEQVEPRMHKLQAEQRCLEKLEAIAG
jgi:hypothetical protein